MSCNYRVYAWKRAGGIDHAGNANTLESAYTLGNKLSGNEYSHYLIIRHDFERDSDFPIERVELERSKVKEKSK